jgi:hypothetical protein
VKTALTAITISLTLLAGLSPLKAATVTLYDGAAGGLPDSQGWLDYRDATVIFPIPPFFLPGGGSQTAIAGGTSLNSLGSGAQNNIYAAYSNRNTNVSLSPLSITPGDFVNPSFPTLDRNAGYTLTFTVQIATQVNDGPDGANRAGFNVTALSSDLRGIEIGFRTNDIFAQSDSPLFTQAEINNSVGSLLAAVTTYSLNISGDNYSLTGDGTPILSGALRDYSSFGDPVNPYSTPNLILLGDNTTEARANINLYSISLTANAAAAVPFDFNPTFALLILGAWTGFRHFKNSQK